MKVFVIALIAASAAGPAVAALCGLPNAQDHYLALENADPPLDAAAADALSAEDPILCKARLALNSYIDHLAQLYRLDSRYALSQKIEALQAVLDAVVKDNSLEALAMPKILGKGFKVSYKYLSAQEIELMDDMRDRLAVKPVPAGRVRVKK